MQYIARVGAQIGLTWNCVNRSALTSETIKVGRPKLLVAMQSKITVALIVPDK